LISIAFLPGYFKLIGVIVPPLIHAILAFAVHHQHRIALYASFGLIVRFYKNVHFYSIFKATVYVMGLFSIIIFLMMEVVQSRRGSYKLYILHAASLSGIWSNVLLVLMYGLNKLIKVSQNNYSNFVNEA
jgi:hypothetical protein